jgi:hypothetical protein
VKLTKKLASVGATVLMATSFGLVAAPAAHAAGPAPLDPTQWNVTCNSVVGVIKFKTPLTLAPTTATNTITVAATTSDCTVPQTPGDAVHGDPVDCVAPAQVQVTTATGATTQGSTAITLTNPPDSFKDASAGKPKSDVGALITATLNGVAFTGIPKLDHINTVTDATHADLVTAATLTQSGLVFKMITVPSDPVNPCVNLAPAPLKGTLSSVGNGQPGCLGLSGLSTGTSGNNVSFFKNGAKGVDGLTLEPKLLTAGSGGLNANVTSAVSQTNGTTFGPTAWGASYGEFQIGAAFGTSVSARNNDAFEGDSSQITGHGLGDTFDATTGQSTGAILALCLSTGVRVLNFGIGGVHFGN